MDFWDGKGWAEKGRESDFLVCLVGWILKGKTSEARVFLSGPTKMFFS